MLKEHTVSILYQAMSKTMTVNVFVQYCKQHGAFLCLVCSKETLGDMDLCCHGSVDLATKTIDLTCLD